MSAAEPFSVYVVDDDDGVRASLGASLTHAGYLVHTFGSAEEFLRDYDDQDFGCVILDVRMPGIEGLELQEKLGRNNIDLPIIFITGYANVPMSVRAIKRGAVDFLEKPFRRTVLLERIREAREDLVSNREARRRQAEIRTRLDRLTQRETEVLKLIIGGKPKVTRRELGTALGISPRTAEQHRAKVLTKMEVTSVAELSGLVARSGVAIPGVDD